MKEQNVTCRGLDHERVEWVVVVVVVVVEELRA